MQVTEGLKDDLHERHSVGSRYAPLLIREP